MSNLPAVINEVRGQLNKMGGEFRMALPPHISVDKFTRVAMTAIQGNADLLGAERRSLFGACVKAAQDGLLPDGREAALVIFKGKVQYMPMIGGILKRVRNSGEVASIASQLVYRNDSFRYWVDGDGEHLQHEPLMFGERGEIVGVYALAKTKDGAVYIEVMTKAQVEKVRKVSRASGNGPWVDWWEEMARKTVLRRLSKRLPMSTDIEETIRREEEQYVETEPVPPRPQIQDFTAAEAHEETPEEKDGGNEDAPGAHMVLDDYGQVIYDGPSRVDALDAMRKVYAAADTAGREAIAEHNPDLFAEMQAAV